MILTDEQTFERLASKDNIINLIEHPDNTDPRMNGSVLIEKANPNGGLRIIQPEPETRGSRGPQIPDMIRRLISQTAAGSDETCVEIGNVFGVTPATVSNSARGLVHNRLDTELQEIGIKSKEEKNERAHDLALDSLVASLALVQDNLSTVTTAKEAAKLAVDMSRVVAVLRPKAEDEVKAKTLVVIAMPKVRTETQFETIDV